MDFLWSKLKYLLDKKIYGAYLEKYFLEAKVESADEWINQQ